MIEIDGAAGGGQMLRTSLSLSAVFGKNFRIENIRGKRPEPGLKHQHIEAVKTVARLTGAEVDGLQKGSETLEFRPDELKNESFTTNIGTAGSVTLLLDTVLPITAQFDSSFRLNTKGGTDVKWSPPFSYFRDVKLDLLEEYGFKGDAELEKTGYYPKGGGEAVLETEEYSLEPIRLERRGRLERFEIYSKASSDLESSSVAERQASELEKMLKKKDPGAKVSKKTMYERTRSSGSSLVLKAVYENSVAGFDALGERGKRSEQVAEDVFEQFSDFQKTEAAVDSRMADQLIPFLALSGGVITIPEVTDHVQTNLSVVRKFGRDVYLEGRTVYAD